MAKQEQKDDIDIVGEEKSNSKLLFIIIAVLLLAIIGLAVMIFLENDDKELEITEEESAPLVKQEPVYHAVDTPFVVNFSNQSQGEVRYLQVTLKVMARSEKIIEAFKLHSPAIKHELLLLFYGQNYDNLNTSEGIKALQLLTLEKINDLLSIDPTLEGNLEAVYFTKLIMQ
jgi:flagellar protein FliL